MQKSLLINLPKNKRNNSNENNLFNSKLIVWCIFFLFFILKANSSTAQNAQSDQEAIFISTLQKGNKQNKRNVKLGFNGLKKVNPLNWILGTPMFLYQKLISPEFSSQCLYEPSCSDFSKQLISRYGIIKGVFLSADRLTRCNRLGANDFENFQINPHSHKVSESTDIYSNN